MKHEIDWKIQIAIILCLSIFSYIMGSILIGIIGIGILLILPSILNMFKNKNPSIDDSVVTLKYLQTVWRTQYGMNENIDADKSIIKYCEYLGKKCFAFNAVRSNKQSRILAVVSIFPKGIIYLNTISLNEKGDPFDLFMNKISVANEEEMQKDKWNKYKKANEKKENEEKKEDKL